MEHENQSPLLGMYACDADLFRRVWERVEPEPRPNSPVAPIASGGDDDLDAVTPRPVEVTPPMAEMPLPAQMPTVQPDRLPDPAEDQPPEQGEGEAVVELDAPQSTGDDFPGEDDLPCLGTSSAPQGGQLQQYIRRELEGWQLYRHLARRVNGPNARVLTALASEKHRCARRLAAAYFLISGVRYWPTDQLETPKLPSWLGVLRESFSAEQRREHRYRAAACGTTDPCLRELYSELAADCAAHQGVVRGILEGAL